MTTFDEEVTELITKCEGLLEGWASEITSNQNHVVEPEIEVSMVRRKVVKRLKTYLKSLSEYIRFVTGLVNRYKSLLLEFATLSGLTQIEQNKVNLDLKSRYFSVFNPLNPPCQGDFELFA